jgi:hypothetical protein
MYSRVEHLARSLWLGRFNWSNRMAMYSAYFDESGHPDEGQFLVVAGAVADVKQWVHFEREWLGLIAPLNTRVFHAVDFDKGNPPFDKLRLQEANELLDRLVGIICRRVERSFSGAMDLGQYNVINQKYIFAECYGFPYPSLARSCMGHVGLWADRHSISQEEILYFFEDGAKHRGQIEWIMLRDKLPLPVFQRKADTVPLQVGDFIAWCHNLYLTGHGVVPARYQRALDRLSTIGNDWGLIDFRDPDRIPTVLEIPIRDPRYCYRSRIVKAHGKRMALTHYWSREHGSQAKIIRKTIPATEKPPLTGETAMEAIERYERSRSIINGSEKGK